MMTATRSDARRVGASEAERTGRARRASWRRLAARALVAIALFGQAAGTAAGEQTVDLRTDIARLLKLPEPAGTIVIGNPAIADATLANASTLVLTGRSSGLTNMIILDRNGSLMANVSLRVIRQGPRTINVIRPGEADRRFFCADVCEPISGGGGGGVGAQPVASPDRPEPETGTPAEPAEGPESEPGPAAPEAGAEIAARR